MGVDEALQSLAKHSATVKCRQRRGGARICAPEHAARGFSRGESAASRRTHYWARRGWSVGGRKWAGRRILFSY